MRKLLKIAYRSIILILISISQIYGQSDLMFDAKWEFRLAPHYYLPQTKTLYSGNGNSLRHRGGISGSLHVARNLYFKKHPEFYLSVQAGVSFYPLYDFSANVKNSSIPANSIPPPTKEIGEVFILPTYFDGAIEFHYQLFKKKLFLTGGIGLSVVSSDNYLISHVNHRIVESKDYEIITSVYYRVNFSKTPITGHYNVGLKKFIPFQDGLFGLGVKWVHSFRPYSSGDIRLIRDDNSYVETSYEAYMKHFELQLTIPLR